MKWLDTCSFDTKKETPFNFLNILYYTKELGTFITQKTDGFEHSTNSLKTGVITSETVLEYIAEIFIHYIVSLFLGEFPYRIGYKMI